MAWRTSNAVEGMMFTLNNNDVALPTWTNAPLILEEPTRMLADPLGRIGSDIAPNNMFSQRYPERYAAGLAAGPGSFNLQEYFYGIEVGQTFYIWQQATGRNVRLQFRRAGTDLCHIDFYVYGTTYGGRDLYLTQINPSIEYSKFPFAFLGFHINDELEQGTLYYGTEVGNKYDRYEYAIGRQTYVGFGNVLFDPTNAFYNMIHGHEVDPPSPGGDNPYEGGGLNDEPAGGEDQNFEETSDTIAEPTLPSSPATGSGFITAYVPTLSEINDVADYLIDPSVLQALAGTVLKLSDVVIGLSIFPFTIAATGSKEVKLNLMGIHLTTGVTCHYSDSQFVPLNMGTLEVKKYWDNCLDFDPYTRISIYLPYVGYVDLDTDEVMGREITVKYNVDIVTGCCLALIIVDGSVLYQYPGECSCQIPVTSVSFDSFLQSAVQLGITAASGARAVKGAAASVSEAGAGVLAAEGMADTRDALSDYNAARASFSGIKANVGDSLLSASVSAVVNAKGQYSHAGAMSSCAGILGTQKPFLIIKRPKQCMPEGFEGIRGFPCNMKATLSDLEGYTEVGDIHLNIPNATVQEIVECEQFLKEGVFL